MLIIIIIIIISAIIIINFLLDVLLFVSVHTFKSNYCIFPRVEVHVAVPVVDPVSGRAVSCVVIVSTATPELPPSVLLAVVMVTIYSRYNLIRWTSVVERFVPSVDVMRSPAASAPCSRSRATIPTPPSVFSAVFMAASNSVNRMSCSTLYP